MLHEHHRDRLREKAIKDVSLLNEFEILELILFGVIPRKNTNDVAHRLIDEFGSIKAVFSASPDMLMKVEGVGKTVAAHISALNSVLNEVCDREEQFPSEFSFASVKTPLIKFFRNFREEVFLIFFIDKNHKIISRKTVYGHSATNVEIDLNDLAKQVVLIKPSFVVIAHNHLSGNAKPSKFDDNATHKISMVLQLNGVSLVDHIIVGGENVYSYYFDNKIDKINNTVREALENE